MDVGGKISSFTKCGTWFCARSNDDDVGGGGAMSRASGADRQRSPSLDAFQGPGPSPGGSASCDDSVPPPKNCYRLVMLG